MDEYIGISEDRLHHILGVARKCYQLGKINGFDEDTCKMLFAMGWNHDIGYEYSKTPEEHSEVSAYMLFLQPF